MEVRQKYHNYEKGDIIYIIDANNEYKNIDGIIELKIVDIGSEDNKIFCESELNKNLDFIFDLNSNDKNIIYNLFDDAVFKLKKRTKKEEVHSKSDFFKENSDKEWSSNFKKFSEVLNSEETKNLWKKITDESNSLKVFFDILEDPKYKDLIDKASEEICNLFKE